MVVLGQLPLSFFESVAWRHFCHKANFGYTPHSRRTATKDIIKTYVERKDAVKKWFLCNNQRVSLTTYIWVSPTTGASYMVITVHYIDASWRLKKLIIGFKHITDHKVQLRKFQSSFALGSDQAFVLDGEFLHMRCSAHIINLIIRDGMVEIDQNVVAVRNAISYVRSHTNRLRSFELKVDSGKITRGSLPLDIKTRWNSTYLMLTTAQKFKVPFDKMEAEDKLYNDHFCEFENGEKRPDFVCLSRTDPNLVDSEPIPYQNFEKKTNGTCTLRSGNPNTRFNRTETDRWTEHPGLFSSTLVKLGFKKSNTDHTLFTKLT
ncbi:hypothetical protein N665_0082s0027 [Sinapis alba]|nr:hypothetical protein N665_0082s0027 [Sinapis alba]